MIKIALFGIHKLLLDSLIALEKKALFPEIVIFPTLESSYHTEVEKFCNHHQIRFLRPVSVNNPDFLKSIDKVFNRIVVTGYNEIFSTELLSLASLGKINCHGGLLPEEQGPLPYKWAIYNNQAQTGVTYHQMTEKVDQGKIYIRNLIPINDDDTNETLLEKICKDFAQTVPIFFSKLDLDELSESENYETCKKGNYQGQIPLELTKFDLSLSSDELTRRVRAFSPRPGVFFQLEKDKRLLIKKVTIDLALIKEDYIILQAQDRKIVITDFEIVDQS